MNRSYDITFVLPVVTYDVPPGGYNVVFRLANEARLAGLRASLVFMNREGGFVRNIIGKLFDNHRLTFFYWMLPILNRFRHIDYDYGILKGIDIFFTKNAKDLDISSNAYIATAWQTAGLVHQLASNGDSKGFYLIQNEEDRKSFSGNLSEEARKTYDLPLKKIVINKSLQERFKTDYPYFLQIGFEDSYFRRIESIPKDPFLVMMPLRFESFKGGQTGINALTIVKEKRPELKYLAFGNMNPDLVPSFIEYKLRPPNSLLLEMYNRASIFVLPSEVEGFPVPPLEAMSCGCALVTTLNGGVESYAVDGENCLSCPPGDHEALASRVEKLVERRELMDKISKNGFVTAGKYSFHSTVDRFLAIMKEEGITGKPKNRISRE